MFLLSDTIQGNTFQRCYISKVLIFKSNTFRRCCLQKYIFAKVIHFKSNALHDSYHSKVIPFQILRIRHGADGTTFWNVPPSAWSSHWHGIRRGPDGTTFWNVPPSLRTSDVATFSARQPRGNIFANVSPSLELRKCSPVGPVGSAGGHNAFLGALRAPQAPS